MPQLNKMYRKTNSVSSTSPLMGLQDPMAISPLQRFVRAKKLINQTFDELTKYLKEVRDFLMDCEVSDELDHETRKDLEQVKISALQLQKLQQMKARLRMMEDRPLAPDSCRSVSFAVPLSAIVS